LQGKALNQNYASREEIIMKRMKASIVLTGLAAMLIVFMACSGSKAEVGTGSLPGEEIEVKRIGIVQVVEHPSLNTIRESFVRGLEKRGFSGGGNLVIDYQNAQGEQANLKTICRKFSSHRYDLIVAIATPSAQAAVGETSEIPVLFSACTDPVGSGLVDSLERPGKKRNRYIGCSVGATGYGAGKTHNSRHQQRGYPVQFGRNQFCRRC
jgi:putative ABC transport system substrate-binding protein